MKEPRAFPRRWNICGAELIAETFSSRIWKVLREDDSVAVVKALVGLRPSPQEEIEGLDITQHGEAVP